MKKLLVVSAVALAGLNLRADVWQDCRAWYMGGVDKDGDGLFESGDMVDMRHAADPDADTHGGNPWSSNSYASNLLETVTSQSANRIYPGQRTIYLPQPDTFVSGTYKVKEQAVVLPFPAVTNVYTLLVRIRPDATQPTNKNFVTVVNLGYNGGGGDKDHGYTVRYYPGTEQFGLLYHNGNDKPMFVSFTNDTCRTFRGVWSEMAITLNKGTLRVGVRAEGMESMVWNSKTYDYSGSVAKQTPYNNKIILASTTNYGSVWSTSCTPFRGSYQMVSYWERVLTDDEVAEAFAYEGPQGAPDNEPKILRYGSADYGAEMFTGVTSGDVTRVSGDVQDIADFPAAVEAGRTIELPFDVPATCTNMAQVLRVVGATGADATTLNAVVDGVFCGELNVIGGGVSTLSVPREVFAEGTHILSLSVPVGSASARLSQVEISGSWRLGWIDAKDSEMGGDRSTSAGWKTFALSEMSTNRWKLVQSCSTRTRGLKLLVNATKEDAETRRHRFRAVLTNSQPIPAFDVVVWVNGVEKWRRFKPKNAELGGVKVDFTLKPGELHEGENEFCFMNEENPEAPLPSGGQTFCHYDFYELEVGKEPTGGMLILR